MSRAYVVGVGTTAFKRWPDRTHADLAAEAIGAARRDADLEAELAVGGVWFGSAGLHLWGQGGLGGSFCLQESVDGGLVPSGAPVTNVEAGCATGGVALQAAARAVEAGACDLTLAVGVEKTHFPEDPGKLVSLLGAALDQFDPARWAAFYRHQAVGAGLSFEPGARTGPLLEVCALKARHHAAVHGSTPAQLARVVEKSRLAAAGNAQALWREPMTGAQVLEDKPLVPPLTRSMCATPTDGAAAAWVASDALLDRYPDLRRRAVSLRAQVSAGGRWRGLGEPSVVSRAAAALFEGAGEGLGTLDVVELHDSTAAAELERYGELGLCEVGQEAAFLGATGPDDQDGAAVNPSGGILSRGHPIAATGLAQVAEICRQLRGEAGARQVRGARLGLVENAGGLIGFDEAVCVMALLEAP